MRFMRPANGHGNGRRRRRGQSLVEFAIVLPILLFLTLVALDFGRVYLGWINLQSMSRIGRLASNPTAWQPGGDASVKAQYQNQIKRRLGHELPAADGRRPRRRAQPDVHRYRWQWRCRRHRRLRVGPAVLHLRTHHAGDQDVLGGSIAVSASSVFPVSTGMTSLRWWRPNRQPRQPRSWATGPSRRRP